jgi:hypothetical protein
MLELHATDFVNAVRELRRLTAVLDVEPLASMINDTLDQGITDNLIISTQNVVNAIQQIGARSAWVSANRLLILLNTPQTTITVAQVRAALSDIESRFMDELGFNRLFVVYPEEFWMFDPADKLLGVTTAARFLRVSFDCEEAAKCFCLGRPTACVFHSMRMLEIAIAALAKKLSIPDPVLANDRNWGNMLNSIKKELDSKYPKSSRLTGSEGLFLESVYVSLDAVKNPWRNETMHVSTIYTDDEARHIFSCSIKLLQKMATGFDEDGKSVAGPSLIP